MLRIENITYAVEGRPLFEAASATMNKNRWLLENLAAPLKDRPIAEITSKEILELLKRVELSGRRETARRLRGVIGNVFRYAIVTLRATSDPTIPIHGALLPPKVKPRAAILDEKKFGRLIRSIDEYDGWPMDRNRADDCEHDSTGHEVARVGAAFRQHPSTPERTRHTLRAARPTS